MLAYNLKKLMLNSGLSSKKLANKININRSTLIKILNGTTPNPRIETIYSLANYFKISVEELLGENNANLIDLKDNSLSNNIKDTLLQLMKSYNIESATSLSQLSNISYTVIEDILLGKTSNPHIGTLQKLSHFFNISIPQLLGFTTQNTTNFRAEKAKIPVYDIVGLENFSAEKSTPINHIEAFRKEEAKNSFAVSITTDTLLPDFSEGELLIVDSEEPIRTNDYVIAKIENKAWIYECINMTSDVIYLKKAGKFTAEKFEINDIKILGVIIQKVINEIN